MGQILENLNYEPKFNGENDHEMYGNDRWAFKSEYITCFF